MAETVERKRAARDPRLDFFRGLGMFIILVAHIPWNPWTEWIPARFGFSDAADLFVFCSGMASALAFAAVFDRHGLFVGALRILHRVWQVYWAHIGGFFVVLGLVGAVDQWLGVTKYADGLALGPVFADFKSYIGPIMTLRFVPSYFDILPMYLAILAMIPAMMALERVHRLLPIAASLVMWLGAQAGWLGLTADPVSGRLWFFNPFGWQIIFFSGFGFMRGWLPAPPRDLRLALVAVVFVVVAAPVSCQESFQCYAGWGHVPALGAVHEWLQPAIDKTGIGALRYLHFMATAYLAFLAAGPRGANLRGPVADRIRRVGQQTLAVFLTGLVAAQALGMILDTTGRGPAASALVNLGGFAILVAAAALVTWFKAAPWTRAGRAPAAAETRPERIGVGATSPADAA